MYSSDGLVQNTSSRMHRAGTKCDGLTIRLMAKDEVGNSIDYRTERLSILDVYEFQASLIRPER